MNTATIRIPTPLRGFTNGREEVPVHGGSVAEALADLGEQCPGLLERVLDKDQKLRPFVNIFVGSKDIRTLRGLATPVEGGAVLSIIPAVAGGIPAVAGG